MAVLTGVIEYLGSFKSIRHWRNRKNRLIYAGEKGGANVDLIKHHPVFARTRENIDEFKGVGIAVKSIRRGMLQLLPEQADTDFTGRLVAMVKMINLTDTEGKRGKKAIPFSLNRSMLKSLNLHEKRKLDFQLKKCIGTSHPESRAEATITINSLNPSPSFVSGTPQYYRVLIHLSIISDYAWSEVLRSYEPLNKINEMSAYAYSDYIPINTPLTATLTATFPEGTMLSGTDTVLQCVGIDFYSRSGVDGYVPYAVGNMLVYDVF